MKTFIKQAVLLLIAFTGFFGETTVAQSILNPADPIVTYNPNSPPTQPAYGTIGKWVRTKDLIGLRIRIKHTSIKDRHSG